MKARRVPMDESKFRTTIERRTRRLREKLGSNWSIVSDKYGVRRFVTFDGTAVRYCGSCATCQRAVHVKGKNPCTMFLLGELFVRPK